MCHQFKANLEELDNEYRRRASPALGYAPDYGPLVKHAQDAFGDFSRNRLAVPESASRDAAVDLLDQLEASIAESFPVADNSSASVATLVSGATKTQVGKALPPVSGARHPNMEQAEQVSQHPSGRAAPADVKLRSPTRDEIRVESVGDGRRRTISVRRFRGDVEIDSATVRGPALTRLFDIVVEAGGATLTWSDVRQRWMEKGGWKGKLLAEATLRDYGRRISKPMKDNGLIKYWRYSPESISWAG